MIATPQSDGIVPDIMENKLYLGIDNGLDGGIVGIDGDGHCSFKKIMPTISGRDSKRIYDIPAMISTLTVFKERIRMVILEKSQAFPGQGRTSAWSTGHGQGIWEGIIMTLNIPCSIVGPQSWQRVIFRDMNFTETKQASLLACQRLFPNESWLATERSRRPHDGLTDAACLAEYGRRIYR